MEEFIYYNDLYDIYSSLLTETQRKYFEDYYFNNLSFSEMAEDYDVSRNAAFKQVHIVIQKLEEYEKRLRLLEKKKLLLDIISQIKDEKIKSQLENLI